MSSFCTAKATHIFSAKKIQHICVSLDVNFNESLTNDIVSFEQLGPDMLRYGYLGLRDNESRLYLSLSFPYIMSLFGPIVVQPK